MMMEISDEISSLGSSSRPRRRGDENDHEDGDYEDDHHEETSDSQYRISWMDACIHLMKGNLGPGCLNIPHAFALSGWLLGSILFCMVALQGIYSMYILSYCKDLLTVHHHHRYSHHQLEQDEAFSSSLAPDEDPRQESQSSSAPRQLDDLVTSSSMERIKFTFMVVAERALGVKIHVQIFLFVLQVGVCCVFLSLLSTNLQAQIPLMGQFTSVMLVTLALLVIVLQRNLIDLRWLSTVANIFMIIAIITACALGISAYLQRQNAGDKAGNQDEELAGSLPRATSNLGDIATFVTSMFFSFEGIGLVLPVENSFTIGYASIGEESRASRRYRRYVLPGAMSMVGVLFMAIGLGASFGYPDNRSGSITAYLREKYPDYLWLDVVNVLVMVAVFLTFPLQLTPAMEVLEEWIDTCKKCGCAFRNGNDENTSPESTAEQSDSNSQSHPDALLQETDHDDLSESLSTQHRRRCCYLPLVPCWVLQRYVIVFGCAVVVLVVDDLGLLMSLFGAVGQTGLALMPCVIHRSLQRQGIAPQNLVLCVMDIFTISISSFVMIAGLGFSSQKLFLRDAESSPH